MQKKPSGKLRSIKCHDFGLIVILIIPPSKANRLTIKCQNSRVTNGDSVSIASKITNNMTRRFKRLLTKDNPNGRDLVEAKYPGSVLDPNIIFPVNTTVNLFKESVFNFWTEARKLVLLWNMFEAVSNRNIETLKEFIVIENTETSSDSPLNKDAIYFRGKVVKFSFTMDFSSTLEEIINNPFPTYQLIGFEFVKSEVEKHLTDLTISSNLKNLNPVASRDHDLYELNYYIRPKNLLQAFYLQFNILLNGIRNKICPNCWKPFSPSKREDQIYCTKECKNNAKKKRQRQDHPELMFKELLYEDRKHNRLSATDRKKIEDTIEDKGLRDAKALRNKLMNKKKDRGIISSRSFSLDPYPRKFGTYGLPTIRTPINSRKTINIVAWQETALITLKLSEEIKEKE